MSILTVDQLNQYAANAGFSGSDFFTQAMIVTVAVILALIGIIVLVFSHGAPHPQAVAKEIA